jgi:hypothetical protein
MVLLAASLLPMVLARTEVVAAREACSAVGHSVPVEIVARKLKANVAALPLTLTRRM